MVSEELPFSERQLFGITQNGSVFHVSRPRLVRSAAAPGPRAAASQRPVNACWTRARKVPSANWRLASSMLTLSAISAASTNSDTVPTQ